MSKSEIHPSTEPSFSLVVPAYNEENRLGDVHRSVSLFIESRFKENEIIYVDDGSTDHTYERLADYQKTNPKVKIIRHPKNYGKGRAVRTGLEAATGDIVLFSDADFSTPIEEIEKLIPYLSNGYDIAIGSRGVAGANVEIPQSFLRETTGKIGNAVVQTFLLLPFEDTQCGFKLYKSDALRLILPKLTIDGFAFDMELLVAAMANGLKVAEIPVTWRNVLESKVQSIHNLEVLRDVFKIRYKSAMGHYF